MDVTITLAEIFDKHFTNVKFDNKLASGIYKYQTGYLNMNSEHMEFFGGNLLGVQVIRYRDKDVIKLYNDVLDIDYHALVTDIRTVTTINHEFKISGDVFNLTCMYIIHRFLTSRVMTDTNKNRAAYDMGLVFFYRCISALTSYLFRYPADPKIAQAAYAALSNKYLIKRLGSWSKVMDYRSKDLIDPKGLHYKNLMAFTDDLETVYAINDSQGRIKDLVKNYYGEFKKVHSNGDNVGVTSSTFLDAEGEETVREKTKSVESYISYMQLTIIDKNSFVRDDLVGVIARINTNTSYRIVKHTLGWMVDGYMDAKLMSLIDSFVQKVIVQSMHLIQNNIDPAHSKDLAHIISTLKNLYLSTRSVDKDLVEIRELGELIVKKANGKVSSSLSMSTRTSLILYVTLRALVGKVNKT